MSIIILVLNIFMWAIIIRSLLSWVDAGGRNPISQLLIQVTEPVLAPVRNLLGGGMGGIDFSPLIVIVILQVVAQALTGVR